MRSHEVYFLELPFVCGSDKRKKKGGGGGGWEWEEEVLASDGSSCVTILSSH